MGNDEKNIAKVSWLYFVALATNTMATTVLTTFLVFYMTERMLITTIVMSGVMLATRIADLVMGVLVGVIIQKFRPRLGQYRTWLLYGPLAVAVGLVISFTNPDIPVAVKAGMVFIGYLLMGIGMSFIQLSQNGMLANIAGPEMKIRMQISGKIVQGQNAGRILSAATMLPLIMFLEARGADGYFLVQLGFAVIAVIGQLFLFLGTKQYEKYLPPEEKITEKPGRVATPGVGSMIIDTMKNGQLVILFIADSLRFAATMSIAALAAYYFNLVAKNPNMMTLYLTIQGVLGFVLAFASAPFARRLGKKNSALFSGIITTAAYLLLGLFARNNAVLYIVFAVAAYASQLVVGSCGVNLYLDCGEYQLYKSGKDNRTFVMSMFGIGIKIGFMLSSVFVGIVLTGGGYDSAVVTNPGRMVLLIGFIPAALNLLYTLLMAVYGITEAKSREYAEENFRRKQTA